MATQLVRITSDVEIPYLTYNGQPVLTFALIDRVHNRVEGTAKRNFSTNRKRFIDGEDYFYVTDSQGLDEIRTSHPGILKDAAHEITLLTESGYLMLVKSFTDDLSWQIQRQLVKLYFRVKDWVDPPAPPLPMRVREPIAPAQYYELKNLVHDISTKCHWHGKAHDAIWARVRKDCDTDSVLRLPVESFDYARDLLKEILTQAQIYFKDRIRRDEIFIEEVIRRGSKLQLVLSLLPSPTD